MLRKRVLISAVFLSALFCLVFSLPAFASDVQYQFQSNSTEEFYNPGTTSIHFNAAVPGYVQDIYDLTPQQVHNSEYGATIIVPEGYGGSYPSGNAPSTAPKSPYSTGTTNQAGITSGTFGGSMQEGSISGAVNGVGSAILPGDSANNSGYPEYTQNDYEANPLYPITAIEEVRKSDGSIGTLKIPAIGLTVTAYDGDTYEAMKKGVGHIASSSCWTGNIGLVGHNRGSNNNFGKLKNLQIGDEITYTTTLGTRTYVVTSVQKISETDWSYLQYTTDNRITLVTCVEDVPSQRLCVQATEKL